MDTATYTLAKREFDKALHALYQVIEQAAKSIAGCLGEES